MSASLVHLTSDQQIIAFTSLIDANPEHVPGEDMLPINNDSWIDQQVREADADNQRAQKGSRAVFLVDLAHAGRLWRAVYERGMAGDAFVEFALRITGFAKNKAYELLKLHLYADKVMRWVEIEKEKCGRGTPYRYPTWKAALAYARPKAPAALAKPPAASAEAATVGMVTDPNPLADELAAAHARCRELEAEIARLTALLATPAVAVAPPVVEPVVAVVDPVAEPVPLVVPPDEVAAATRNHAGGKPPGEPILDPLTGEMLFTGRRACYLRELAANRAKTAAKRAADA